MRDYRTSPPQARLFVGMGGSGLKTISSFVRLLTQHSEEVKQSEVLMSYLLVDTDAGDLAKYEAEIRAAYKHVHREPIIRCVLLSANITDFNAFVSSKLEKQGHHERLRQVWWYRPDRDRKSVV